MNEKFNKSLRLLRELFDLQNGAPLPTYEKEWLKVMTEIDTFLLENESKIHEAHTSLLIKPD
jgi:hypothetical protein